MAVVMKGMVATVKDEEVQAICAYLATVQP
jgi:cytochrome c553